MTFTMMDSLLFVLPIIILATACVGLFWSVLKKRIYIIGFTLLLLGTGIHYWGLHVGRWEGMAISLFIGGGVVLLGLVTLLVTLLYSKFKS